jgi:hypothetical protein
MNPSPTTLPDRVRGDLRDGRAELFTRELMPMGAVTAATLVVTLPLTGVAVALAIDVAAAEHDHGSQIFISLLIAICVGLTVSVLRRWSHHERLVDEASDGADAYGIYVSQEYVCAWLPGYPDGWLVFIERAELEHAQLTENYFYSENVSRTANLVSLRRRDAERPWVIFNTGSFGVDRDALRDVFISVLGLPWSDESVWLDDEAREARAIYVS